MILVDLHFYSSQLDRSVSIPATVMSMALPDVLAAANRVRQQKKLIGFAYSGVYARPRFQVGDLLAIAGTISEIVTRQIWDGSEWLYEFGLDGIRVEESKLELIF